MAVAHFSNWVSGLVMTSSNCRLFCLFLFLSGRYREERGHSHPWSNVPCTDFLVVPDSLEGKLGSIWHDMRIGRIHPSTTHSKCITGNVLCTDQLSTVTNTTWIELIPFSAWRFLRYIFRCRRRPPVTFFYTKRYLSLPIDVNIWLLKPTRWVGGCCA